MELLARLEGRDLYLAACRAFDDREFTVPGHSYFRLLVLADGEQLRGEDLRSLAREATARGAYATLAAGTGAETVERAFHEAIVEGRYEVPGRTFITAIGREGLEKALWDAFYSIAGDADIEEDLPPVVVLVKDGDARIPELRLLAGRLKAVFEELLDDGDRAA